MKKIRTLSQTLNKHSDREISRCHVEGNVDVTLQSDEKLFVVYPSELGVNNQETDKKKKEKKIFITPNIVRRQFSGAMSASAPG